MNSILNEIKTALGKKASTNASAKNTKNKAAQMDLPRPFPAQGLHALENIGQSHGKMPVFEGRFESLVRIEYTPPVWKRKDYITMPINRSDRVTESQIGLAVLQILADIHSGEATISDLKQRLPNYLNLSDADHEQSVTRPNEEMWEQQVRNLISHRGAEGNIIAEELAEYNQDKHSIRITETGRSHI